MHYFAIAIAECTEEGLHKLLDFIESNDYEAEVPEHEEVCYCARNIAERKAREYAEKKLGKTRLQLEDEYEAWRKGRPEFDALVKRMENRNKTKEEDDQVFKDMMDDLSITGNYWSLTVKRPIALLEKQFLSTYDYSEADPDCDECKGTGKVRTTYSHDGHHNGWRVGGRWCGAIHGGEFIYGVNWGPVFEGIAENAVMVENIKDHVIPFALITPENEWVIKDKVDWIDIIGEEKYLTDPEAEDNGWKEYIRKEFAKYANRNYLAIGIDIHS